MHEKEESEIILADGTYIGPISSLQSDETDQNDGPKGPGMYKKARIFRAF